MSARRSSPREEILAAAARAMAHDGYHGTSMRALARETHRSLAGLYAHFGSKGEILFALHDGAFRALIADAERALAAEPDPVRRMRAFALNHVRYFEQHPEVMRVLILEAGALPAPYRPMVRALKERYFRLGRDVLHVAVGHGRSAPGGADERDLERVTYSFFGMLNWIWAWYEPSRHGSPEQLAETIERIALRGMAVCGSDSPPAAEPLAVGGAP